MSCDLFLFFRQSHSYIEYHMMEIIILEAQKIYASLFRTSEPLEQIPLKHL